MLNLEKYKETIEDNLFLLKICRAFCPVGQLTGVETYNPHSILTIIYYLNSKQLQWTKENVEPIYMCTLCGRCGKVCSSYSFSWVIEAARVKANEEGVSPEYVKNAQVIIENYIELKGENLDKIGSREENNKVLVFAGIYHALHIEEVKNALELLDKLGVKYDFLGGNEPYTGTNYFDLGVLDKALEHSKKTTDMLNQYEQVIVLDPAAFFTIKERYPKYDLTVKPEVKHYTQVISSMVLPTQKSPDYGEITISDPCELIRSIGTTHLRELLKRLNIPYREPQYTMELSYPTGSCGSFNLMHPELSRSITENKITMIKESTDANTILTTSAREKHDMIVALENLDFEISVLEFAEFMLEVI